MKSTKQDKKISYSYLKPEKATPSTQSAPPPQPTNKTYLSQAELEKLDMDPRLLQERNAEISMSLQNDLDEIRELLKNTAIIYNEAAKLHLEQTRQVSDILSTLKLAVSTSNDKFDKLTSILMLRQGAVMARSKTPEKYPVIPNNHVALNRPTSRKSLSQTHSFIPSIRSKSTNRYEEV